MTGSHGLDVVEKLILNWALVAHAVILATQEAEIRRITVQSQPRQIVCEMLS
jgi:hypothetical protein